jgi:S-adenosylmethionine hydrolase
MTIPAPIITLLTDFGEQDGYVAAMKGVILGLVPEARLIDISHQIKAQDIRQAASVLAEAYPYFPPHTIHLVVVDPGVQERDPIAVETPGGRFVAPDNGVLTYVKLAEPSLNAIRLDNPKFWLTKPSHTFHGRDIFSPCAAHLAQGLQLSELGTPLENITLLELPKITVTDHAIRGEVERIDRFGNVLTNIMRLVWIDDETLELQPTGIDNQEKPVRFNAQKARVTCGWHSLEGIHKRYSELAVGQRLALVGSGGELEIAMNQGNASHVMSIRVGDPVTIQLVA